MNQHTSLSLSGATESRGPTIASDEDMDICFVLADDHAPNAATAKRVLWELAPVQWGYRLDPALMDDIAEPQRRSYKWGNVHMEECLIPCDPDDPERDSDWWVFDTIAPGDWESVDA
jgi:hypothetical protein